MGLAPFFDRARQSAAQVLRDCGSDVFEKRLGDVTVTLAFDTAAATSVEGLAALDMTARLVARLYPRVRVLALDGVHTHADELVALMREINPDIEIADRPAEEEIVIVAGSTTSPTGHPIYMGSDRWIARVSTTGPLGFGSSSNPFGAGAAACIAVANVFRAVFADWLPRHELADGLALSLLNFATGRDAANGDMPAGADIGLVQLVGVGAIGNAFVWALSRLRGVGGHVDFIDHEAVDLTNLQRYVLPTMADENAVKVDLAAAAMRDCGISSSSFRGTWAEYVQQHDHRRFETVAVALDTAKDRVQVQGSLPHRIVNSWTQAGDLGVSRHGFDGEDACLACMYLPTAPRRNEDEIVTGELGFPPEYLTEIRTMLHFGTPVTEPFVRMVASNLKIDADALLPFVGL
ncbi:MAG: E2 ligase fold family C protein, partial [Janthinobacterium lividum]